MDDLNACRRSITVAGTFPVQLSVIDAGPPPAQRQGTLVFIHGAGGQAAQWDHQLRHFRATHRVIAADLRGHGQSGAPPGAAYSLDEFLWDFTQSLTLLEVEEPFVLLAHSFGGPLALTFAATQGHRLSKLVLVATAPQLYLHPALRLAVRAPEAFLERVRRWFLATRYATSALVLKRVVTGTLIHWTGWGLLPQISVPTLSLTGQWDILVPRANVERMTEAIAGAQHHTLRYTRHFPHRERPAAANRAIGDFLLAKRRSWRGQIEDIES